jgi:hypothetical protein
MSSSNIDYGAGLAPRFALHRVGRIVFQRWYAAPERGDGNHVIRWVGTERRTSGTSLVIVEVVTSGVGLPSREVVADTMPLVRGYRFVRSLHLIVLEGNSLERRLARGIFATMTYLLGEQLVVAPTVDEAIDRAAAVVEQDPVKTRASLEALGVLRAGSPAST